VPGVDRRAIGRGLAAYRVEPDAVEEGRPQRMAGERLIEPRDGGGGGERDGQRRIGGAARGNGIRDRRSRPSHLHAG
jgi:hypothetical protein